MYARRNNPTFNKVLIKREGSLLCKAIRDFKGDSKEDAEAYCSSIRPSIRTNRLMGMIYFLDLSLRFAKVYEKSADNDNVIKSNRRNSEQTETVIANSQKSSLNI